ncbi:MAG: hypothetical protein AABY65_12445, partial [Nitrospirota bacterium]
MAVETFRDATIQPLSRPDLQPAGTSYTGDFALVESGYWANEALINWSFRLSCGYPPHVVVSGC